MCRRPISRKAIGGSALLVILLLAATSSTLGQEARPADERAAQQETSPATGFSTAQPRRPAKERPAPVRPTKLMPPAAREEVESDEGCGSKAPTARVGRAAPDPRPNQSGGPQPQWVCDAPTIDLEPVWFGQPIRATWLIRNEGEGDLVIKLKGG